MEKIQQALDEIAKIVGFKVALKSWKSQGAIVKGNPLVLVSDMWLPYGRKEDGFWFYVVPADDPNTNNYVTYWRLVQFPGCCAFAISTAVSVAFKYSGKGINKYGMQIREELAKLYGYTALVCTDVIDNIKERKTLTRAKFTDIYTTTNRRTRNEVAISIKQLEYED